MASDPVLLDTARKQLGAVRGDVMAFLGWWLAWKNQDGIDRDDLIGLIKDDAELLAWTGEGPP